jgi:hypothetical protein
LFVRLFQLKATETVLEQAKLVADNFSTTVYEQGDYFSIAAEPDL